MKNLYFIFLFLVLNGCKKSDDGGVDQQPSSGTKVLTVTSKTGRIWMDRNLGASRVATSSNDSEAFGYLYQWGRGSDGHQIRNSLTTNILSNTDQPGNGLFILAPDINYGDWRSSQNNNLWQGVNGINNPCPTGFRIPTFEEWKQEVLSWSTRDASGAFNSPLKLTIGGQRSSDSGFNGNLRFTVSGYYWSSSTWDLQTVAEIRIGSLGYDIGAFVRSNGNSCRCIKN
jgi:uncharacterized protein (TIGR02145 family)